MGQTESVPCCSAETAPPTSTAANDLSPEPEPEPEPEAVAAAGSSAAESGNRAAQLQRGDTEQHAAIRQSDVQTEADAAAGPESREPRAKSVMESKQDQNLEWEPDPKLNDSSAQPLPQDRLESTAISSAEVGSAGIDASSVGADAPPAGEPVQNEAEAPSNAFQAARSMYQRQLEAQKNIPRNMATDE